MHACTRPTRPSVRPLLFVRSFVTPSVRPSVSAVAAARSVFVSVPFRLLASRNTGGAAVCIRFTGIAIAHTRGHAPSHVPARVHYHRHTHIHIHTHICIHAHRTHVRTHARTHARTFSRERTPEFRLPQFHAQAATSGDTATEFLRWLKQRRGGKIPDMRNGANISRRARSAVQSRSPRSPNSSTRAQSRAPDHVTASTDRCNAVGFLS